jgi:hypothetical protein
MITPIITTPIPAIITPAISIICVIIFEILVTGRHPQLGDGSCAGISHFLETFSDGLAAAWHSLHFFQQSIPPSYHFLDLF